MIVQWNSVFKLILSGLCHLKRGNVEKIDYFKMPSVSVSQSIYTLKSSFYRDFSCLRHAIWRCFTQANSKWVISINQILCLHYVASVTVMGCSLGTKKSFICIDKWRFFFKLIFLWKSLTASPLHKTEHNVIHLMLQIANLKQNLYPQSQSENTKRWCTEPCSTLTRKANHRRNSCKKRVCSSDADCFTSRCMPRRRS